MLSLFTPESLAVFISRAMLAVLFIFQGYDKVFRIGIRQVTDTVYPSFSNIPVPYSLLYAFIAISSAIELVCGLLLLAGLLKYVCLYLLGLNLLIVTAGLSWVNPVGEMKLVFPRLILLLFVLLFPDEYDVLSLSNLIRKFI